MSFQSILVAPRDSKMGRRNLQRGIRYQETTVEMGCLQLSMLCWETSGRPRVKWSLRCALQPKGAIIRRLLRSRAI